MAVKRIVTKGVYGYRVLHARRAGGIVPPAYEAWRDLGTFQAAEICEALAPECHRARIALDLPGLRADAWRWREFFAMDDRVAIVSGHPKPADRHCPFAGFITDVDWGYDAGDEHVVVTCVSNAYRLLRDTAVEGRWMYTAAGFGALPEFGKLACFSALPCDFNAGGRPNMSPQLQMPGVGNISAFTYDGDPEALWWTLPDAIGYLQWFYNQDGAWIENCSFTAEQRTGWPPLCVAVDGMNAWAAMARCCDRAGADLLELVTNSGGLPASGMAIVRRHQGALVSVRHQPIAPDGSFPLLDLAKTNLLSCRLAESTTSCVTRPVVAGGAALVELTVELQKAWDPAKLPASAEGYQVLPSLDGPAELEDAEYVRRYCIGGKNFADWQDVGRLWDANTDGRYAGAPYNLTVPDVAEMVGLEAGSLPVMPFAPQPCLTRTSDTPYSPSLRFCVEASFDEGATWRIFTGCDVLGERLAIRLTAPNLAGVVRPAANAADLPDKRKENLFYMLVHEAAKVRLRLTCSIALPRRAGVQPPWRPTAGTAFETVLWYDAGPFGQRKWRSASSRFYGSDLPADEADVTEALTALALSIQDAAEGGLVEGQLPIEWPDEEIVLTDRVEQIEGIGYDLKTNAGPRKRSPRVVGRLLLLTPDTYSMVLQLETHRGAGIV